MLADAELVVVEMLWAVTLTAVVGTLAGAVYKPAPDTVPTVEFPPRIPETSQFTPVLLVPDTAALNCCDCPVCRLTFRGDIETATVCCISDTVALAEAEV
jgi:hypothetical protein